MSLFECLSVFISSDKVLVHCIDGVRCSPTLFLAYLMIHHDIMLEDAIERVTMVRCIRPNMGFLKQLVILNSKLVCQRKATVKNQTDIAKKAQIKNMTQAKFNNFKYLNYKYIQIKI